MEIDRSLSHVYMHTEYIQDNDDIKMLTRKHDQMATSSLVTVKSKSMSVSVETKRSDPGFLFW